MYTVYVLYSKGFNKIYIGYTADMNSRIISHNELSKKGWTIKYRPWEIVYTEEYFNKSDAMKREQELKTYQGRKFIRNYLENNHT